ncbi:hypothetical protein WDW89_17510 [Deltaproteobacteria bacterium TL4]
MMSMEINSTNSPSKKPAYQLFMVTVVSLLTALFFLDDYVSHRTQIIDTARDHVQQETLKASTAINTNMKGIYAEAKTLADDLASGVVRQTMIHEKLQTILSTNPQILGMGVAYVPNIHAADIRSQTPYYVKRTDAENMDPFMRIQLFTIPFSAIDPFTQKVIIKGIVFVDYSLYDLQTLINDLDMGKTGYGYILSRKGRFLAHPVAPYVRGQKTIFAEAELKSDRMLQVMAEYATQGQSGLMDYVDPQTGFLYWICYEPIPLTEWSMVGLFLKDRTLTWQRPLLHQLIKTIFVWVVFLTLLSALFEKFKSEQPNYLKVFWLLTFLLFLETCFLYYLAHVNPNTIHPGEVVVTNSSGMTQFLNDNLSKRAITSKEPLLIIPTGIFIKSVLLAGEGKTMITGNISIPVHEIKFYRKMSGM